MNLDQVFKIFIEKFKKNAFVDSFEEYDKLQEKGEKCLGVFDAVSKWDSITVYFSENKNHCLLFYYPFSGKKTMHIWYNETTYTLTENFLESNISFVVDSIHKDSFIFNNYDITTKKCVKATVTFICYCKKLNIFPKDVYIMIAKVIYQSRYNDIWHT